MSKQDSPSAKYEDIATRYQAGSIGRDEFFSGLFDNYYASLLRAGRQMGLSDEQSSELAQETFVHIYRYIDRLDPSASIRAYLLATFRNVAFNYIRDHAAEKRDAIAVSEEELANIAAADISLEDSIISKDEVARLRNALALALTPEEAALLISRFVEERTYAEMAEIMGISGAVLRARLNRALMKLQRYLSGESLGEKP